MASCLPFTTTPSSIRATVPTRRSARSVSATRICGFVESPARLRRLLLRVDGFDVGAVFLRNPLALDLHARCEFVADHEVGVEDAPLLDLLRMRQPAVEPLDRLIDEPLGSGIVGPRLAFGGSAFAGGQRGYAGTAV